MSSSRAIRTRRISSREATESCLRCIEEVNPRLNALVEVTAEEALGMADAEDRAAGGGDELGPLHEVPVSIKVNSDRAGHATTNGVVAFQDNVAEVDSPHVKKLREAGAVFVGRSNTPVFSYRWFADNDLHRRTLNPWNEGCTPGGSSGGASSAVASGMMPIARGNDIVGSIRYPACACGVAGTSARLSAAYPAGMGPKDADEAPSVQSMLAQGPLARSVAELQLALDAMSGFDPRDPFAAPMPTASANEPLPRPVRVGLLRDVGVAAPHPAVATALNEAAAWLAEAGYVVEEIGDERHEACGRDQLGLVGGEARPRRLHERLRAARDAHRTPAGLHAGLSAGPRPRLGGTGVRAQRGHLEPREGLERRRRAVVDDGHPGPRLPSDLPPCPPGS